MIASTISTKCILVVNKNEVRTTQRNIKVGGGGSKVGKATNMNRFCAKYKKLLKNDYFEDNPIHSPAFLGGASRCAASKVYFSASSNVGLWNFSRSAG